MAFNINQPYAQVATATGLPLYLQGGLFYSTQGPNYVQVSPLPSVPLTTVPIVDYTTLSTPGAAAAGLTAQLTAYGTIRTSDEPSTRFSDNFDGNTIDTTNRWNTSGTNLPTQANGAVTLSLPATISLSSVMASQPTFAGSVGFQIAGTTAQFDATNIGAANAHRFFGFGVVTAYAYATPLTDGYGFEIDGTGAFNAVVYVGGTRYVINSSNTALITPQSTLNALGAGSSTYGSTLTYPTGNHRLVVFARGDLVFFYVDGLDVPIGVCSFLQPQTVALPLRAASITAGAGPLATTFVMGAVVVADTSSPNVLLTDATYPWRGLQIGSRGDAQVALMDGNKATYSASVTGLVGVAGDILTIYGSATKTVRVTRMSFSGIATAAATMDLTLIKRSTIDTVGTPAAVTATPHDSQSAAATATLNSYTAAPTPGTAVGTPIRSVKVDIAAAGAQEQVQPWDFGNGPKQGIVLRGVAQGLCMNVGATQAGALYNIDVEWTEE